MIGIILAGGTGSRLYPNTVVTSKQLLPIYSVPLLYHPLTFLMKAGIKEFVIITNPENVEPFKVLLGNGDKWGIKINVVPQEKPEGIAQAYLIAEPYTKGQSTVLILGDNIFYGCNVSKTVKYFDARGEAICWDAVEPHDCVIFGHRVKDPHRYGVIEVDEYNGVVGIEEKPEQPKSNIAAVGLYICDETAPERVRKQKPSARGELEITDLIKSYMYDKKAGVISHVLNGGTVWLDAGTKRSYVEAINFVEAVEERTGSMIACPEEVALKQEFIDKTQLRKIVDTLPNAEYREYLNNFL